MEKVTKEQLNKLISEHKDTICIICVNKGVLMTNDCAAFIAINENDANVFFESIKGDLPGEIKEFSAMKFSALVDAYSLSGLFNRSSFKYINVINYGIFEKDELIEKNSENIDYIRNRITGFLDNTKIYSVFNKNNTAFSPLHDYRQYFFSTENEATIFMNQYNNEELNLYVSWIQIDSIVNGVLSDILKSAFDGRNCSGYDINQAVNDVFRSNTIDVNEINDIFNNGKFYILAAEDGSNYIMREFGNTLFFTSKEKVEEFKLRNKANMTHNFGLFSIPKGSESNYLKFIQNTKYISINAEKHCSVETFLTGIGLNK